MKKMLIMLLTLLYGCEDTTKPDTPLYAESKTTIAAPQIVTVTRIGIFPDDLAYSGRRGIYRIKDTQSGTEFIGISGIGIQEIGVHKIGKGSATDER